MEAVRSTIKKIAVLAPVAFTGMWYLQLHYHDYARSSERRLLFLGLSFLLLFGWIFLETLFRKQKTIGAITVQSSFFVYIFAVLTLTGYFILFREVSVHHWWQHMVHRIHQRDRVNVELFRMFRIYRLSSIQIVGNLMMLLPLGIYIPLLYPKLSGFFTVLFIGFLVSLTIETLQLVTSFRSADVDDILLNTVGCGAGYIIFRMAMLVTRPLRAELPQASLPGRMA
jgi:glycopeptide antibiotics resistance protein